MRGKFTSGTSTGVEARVNLKLAGAALTSASSSFITSLQVAGFGGSNRSDASQANMYPTIEPSVGYITFARTQNSVAGLTKINGNDVLASGNLYSFNARIPINGWTNSNVIIGSFNEVMTTPGIGKPKTCYYAFGGASATLAAPTECATGTCVEVVDTCGTGSAPTRAAQGVYDVVTFAAGTFANSSFIKCDCEAYDVTTATTRQCDTQFKTGNQTWASNSSGGANINIISSDLTGTGQDTYVSLKCEGQAP
jgi:hypothetical protein